MFNACRIGLLRKIIKREGKFCWKGRFMLQWQSNWIGENCQIMRMLNWTMSQLEIMWWLPLELLFLVKCMNLLIVIFYDSPGWTWKLKEQSLRMMSGLATNANCFARCQNSKGMYYCCRGCNFKRYRGICNIRRNSGQIN